MFSFPERSKVIQQNGKSVLLMDFTSMEISDSLKMIDECVRFVSTQPVKSISTLTDISNAGFNKETTEALKTMAKANKPYVIAGAVIGVTGMKKIIFDAIMAFSGRKNLKVHATQKDALEWLGTYSE